MLGMQPAPTPLLIHEISGHLSLHATYILVDNFPNGEI
jgi:hypothetical protein